jgi:hypothetical protein
MELKQTGGNTMFKITKIITIAALIVLFVVPVAQASDITFGWTLPTDTRVTQICLYQGTVKGGPYGKSIPCVASSLGQTTVTGFTDGTYYFVATFKTAAALESPYSAEASATIITPIEVPKIGVKSIVIIGIP